MKLNEIISKLDLKVKSGSDYLDVDVTTGYSSDLLSDVMGNSKEGAIWITIQAHQNIVAVAVMKSLAGIILVSGKEPEDSTIAKAEEEKIVILSSELSAFELIGKLYELGISGINKEMN